MPNPRDEIPESLRGLAASMKTVEVPPGTFAGLPSVPGDQITTSEERFAAILRDHATASRHKDGWWACDGCGFGLGICSLVEHQAGMLAQAGFLYRPDRPIVGPPGYLVADLWSAIYGDSEGADSYMNRNGWAETWAGLLSAVRVIRGDRVCGQDAGGEPCGLLEHSSGIHYGDGDLGTSEPLPALPDRPSIIDGERCPTCQNGIRRETVNMVCQTCGHDYSRPSGTVSQEQVEALAAELWTQERVRLAFNGERNTLMWHELDENVRDSFRANARQAVTTLGLQVEEE
jgi:hypothetical protein